MPIALKTFIIPSSLRDVHTITNHPQSISPPSPDPLPPSYHVVQAVDFGTLTSVEGTGTGVSVTGVIFDAGSGGQLTAHVGHFIVAVTTVTGQSAAVVVATTSRSPTSTASGHATSSSGHTSSGHGSGRVTVVVVAQLLLCGAAERRYRLTSAELVVPGSEAQLQAGPVTVEVKTSQPWRQVAAVGQDPEAVTVGVVGQAGLGPGIVVVVSRMQSGSKQAVVRAGSMGQWRIAGTVIV